jgi:hypothetical protein
MSEASEQKLEAEIERVYQECSSRVAALLVAPGATGYSAQVLTACVALYVEYESSFAGLVLAAREFDVGKTSGASQRLSALIHELRQKLKEASYMAAFKVVYEKFDAYVAALPTKLPPNVTLAALGDCLNDLSEFEKSFQGFEPRAKELAAEGLLPFMQEKWLTPLVEVTRRHIAAIKKRGDDLRDAEELEMRSGQRHAEGGFKNLSLLQQHMKNFEDQWNAERTESQKTAVNPVLSKPAVATSQQQMYAFKAMCDEMKAAENSINAQIQASNANIWADRTPLYNAAYGNYQHFLRQIAALEPAAKALADQGQSQLMDSMQAWKTYAEESCATIRKMIGDRQANNLGLMGIATGMQSDWQKHQDEMYKMQQKITESIRSYKP